MQLQVMELSKALPLLIMVYSLKEGAYKMHVLNGLSSTHKHE